MLRIILVWLLLLPVMARADGYKTYEEVWALAAQVDEVTVLRSQLGIDWADTQARALTRMKFGSWSCVKDEIKVMPSGGQTFEVALCMPERCRALPPSEPIVFRPDLQLTRDRMWFTVVFMIDRDMYHLCDRAYRESLKPKRLTVTW